MSTEHIFFVNHLIENLQRLLLFSYDVDDNSNISDNDSILSVNVIIMLIKE